MPKKAKPTTTNTAKPNARRLRLPRRHWWRRTPKAARPLLRPLPSGWNILKQAWLILWRHKKLFLGMSGLYLLLAMLLVQSSNSLDIQTLRDSLTDLEGGGQLAASLSVLGYIIGNPATGAYQLLLIILISLASIWAFRQISANHKIRVRDAYYRGMYPLVPFVLVVLIVFLQLIPLSFGTAIYNAAISYGLANGGLEITLWIISLILFAAWSIYLVLPTLMGLYVVTLPDMTPLKATRSARQLVAFRRWDMIRKILFIGLAMLLIIGLIMIPAILFAAPAASWIFFALIPLLIILAHAYGYTLYRELLEHA